MLDFLLHHFILALKWCPGPDSNRHALWAGDFKSPVSTYFTTRALYKIGGGGRNRTGVHGVAVRCMTTLPPRHLLVMHILAIFEKKTIGCMVNMHIKTATKIKTVK